MNEGTIREKVIAAFNKACTKYPSNNIELVVNDMTGMLDLMYTSKHNSFLIESDIVKVTADNADSLIDIFDDLNLAYSV